MVNVDYLDFDLLIQQAGKKGYRARVLTSPVGQANSVFRIPFSEIEIENYLLRLGPVIQSVRRVDSPELDAAKNFGGKLFEALFCGDLEGCLRRSLDEAARRQARLRIRLRLTDVPGLAGLPWEYLYDADLNSFLALSVETALVRFMELPKSIPPLAVRAPLRVLVMIASPSNYDPLDVGREWNLLHKALADLEQSGQVILDPPLERATLQMLRRRLQQQQYHIFHFIGHGGFDQRTQDGVLALEDEGNGCRFVSGEDLAVLLRNHTTIRLAVLNSCEGARGSSSDPFAGLAQSLTQGGIPAVIAMQFKITDDAAITFASEFYGAVARSLPIDAALTEARVAIFAQGNNVEWGTPVLYLRAPDGRVFDLEPVTQPQVLPHREPRRLAPQPSMADVRLPSGGRSPAQPVKSLEGALDPDSIYYIERRSDRPAIDEIAKRGATITILGPRQVGKSSLLCRLVAAARRAEKEVAAIDFQQFDDEALSSLEVFLRQFCALITHELGMKSRVDDFWEQYKGIGTIQRCARYMEQYVLKELNKQLAVVMDEVDRLLDTTFYTAFFRMLRSWHNSRALKPVWKQLDLVLVSSTEPHYFIENQFESPFNVGLTVTLEDFTQEQAGRLNDLYGQALVPEKLVQLSEFLGGNPYLTQKALYLVYTNNILVDDLFLDPGDDRSPFSQHLQHLHSRLRRRSDLLKGLAQVIRSNSCQDDEVLHRLRGAGLVRREGKAVVARCKLYGDYFRGQLNV